MMYNIPVFEMCEAVRDLAIEIAMARGTEAEQAEKEADDILEAIEDGATPHQAMYNYLVENGANVALHSKAIVLEITPAHGVQLSDLSDKDAEAMYLSANISFSQPLLDEDFEEAAKAVADRFLNMFDFDDANMISVSLTIDSGTVSYTYGDEVSGDFTNSGECHLIQRRAAVLSTQDAVTYLHDSGAASMDTLSTVDNNGLTDLFTGFEKVEYHSELNRFVVIGKPRQNHAA